MSSVPATHDAIRPRVWAGMFVPPVAWFGALNAGYFMVPWACGSRTGTLAIHAVSLATLAASAVCGWLALTAWRESSPVPAATAAPASRARFLALLGTFSGTLFSLLIVAQWLAVLLLDPCEPGPRLPLSPRA